MVKRESTEEIVNRGRRFLVTWQILKLIAAHIDKCKECKAKWNEIREHIGLDPIE